MRNRDSGSSRMPASAKPQTGTSRQSERMSFTVRENGVKFASSVHSPTVGAASAAASMQLRSSNRPSTRPASVKFTGI